MSYKTINISESNYRKLAQYGSVNNSFNDVVTKLLEEHEERLRK